MCLLKKIFSTQKFFSTEAKASVQTVEIIKENRVACLGTHGVTYIYIKPGAFKILYIFKVSAQVQGTWP